MRRLKRNLWLIAPAAMLTAASVVFPAEASSGESSAGGSGIPADAKFACPMASHPDEAKPADRRPHFSGQPGQCPRCGMKLKPIDELDWAKAAKAAGGAEVGYTCPNHQTVLSKEPGECPRCGKPLKPFKVMYTCPNREHAAVIETSAGRCPKCGKKLAPFRGIWLDERMAAANVPPTTLPAGEAPYHCPIHPLVHSQSPGRCTICAHELAALTEAQAERAGEAQAGALPAGTEYVCPMQECRTFSAEPGKCPVCGMRLKPVEKVEWARRLSAASQSGEAAKGAFVCPMHPEATSTQPGTCPICEMQLVRSDQLKKPQTAPESVRRQVDYITEHYLAIQRLLAADSTTKLAQQALGVASASEGLLDRLDEAKLEHADKIKKAAESLRSAAVKMNSQDLSEARVQFVDLSRAAIDLLKQVRPEPQLWGELYIFHCPMSKGDWIQADREIRNPYYGFDMLKCGELRSTE